MTTWNRTAGDVNDTIVAYLYGVTGTPSSSEQHVWITGGASTTLSSSTVAGTDTTGTACLISTIQCGSWLSGLGATLTVKTGYNLEHQITFVDSRVITWQGDAVQVGVQGA